MNCPNMLAKTYKIITHIKYEHMFCNVREQKELARLYIHLLEVREELIQDDQEKGAGEVGDHVLGFKYIQKDVLAMLKTYIEEQQAERDKYRKEISTK